MNAFRPFAILTVALLPAALAGGPILAETLPPSIAVTYADLDLASPDGLEQLGDRVRQAARRLCTDAGVRPLREMIAARRCVAATIATAQPQLQAAVAGRPGPVLASRRVGEAVR